MGGEEGGLLGLTAFFPSKIFLCKMRRGVPYGPSPRSATALNKYFANKNHFTPRKKRKKLSGAQIYSSFRRTELACFIDSSLVSSTVTSNCTVEFVTQKV